MYLCLINRREIKEEKLNNLDSSVSSNSVQELVVLLEKEGRSRKEWLEEEVGM